MRYSLLAAALAVAMGSTSFSASAADNRDQTIAELKAQLEALTAKVAELEERSDAQSDVNIDTAAQLDKITTGSPKIDTKGGVKVTSADGKFEASIGGRIHFDTYAFDRDIASTTGTTEFRRARLTLGGKAYGWEYKLEQDFGAGTNLDGLRDAYIAKSALGGKFTIGHFKPYRAMEELTSSNELLMMERPFASATGLFSGRQFQQGVGYLRAGENYTAGAAVFNAKAKNVIATCRILLERYAGEVPRSREALESLPGVGRKTANVVLNTAFGEPTMAVDTHIFRVANRTGLAPGKDVRAVEDRLMKVVPAEFMQDAHHWLILHGRYVCKARKPDCPQCVIRDLCRFKDKTVA